MAVIEIAKVQIRRGQENQTGIPQLDPGEFGWAEDTEHLFIGKRIVEGAVDDNNTRILTELDLEEFRTLALNTGTAASAYKYRNGVSYIDSSIISVQTKLDSTNPSLVDWGVTISSDPQDITSNLRDAITTLFQNPYYLTDARRQLLIPPGDYYISGVIDLPPYTSLVGSGEGITFLTLTTSTTNMFRTIDGTSAQFGGPFNFDSKQMTGGPRAAKNVAIENMTLQYRYDINTTKSLLSLDNVQDARIKNVRFTKQANTSSYFTNPVILSTGTDPLTTFSGTDTFAVRTVNTLVAGTTATIASSGIGKLVVNTLTYPAYASIDPSTSTWYITGETNSAYYGIYNQVTGTNINTVTHVATVFTQISWDFTSQTTGTYRLSQDNSFAGVDFRKGNYYIEHANLTNPAKLLFEVSLDVYANSSTTKAAVGSGIGVFAVNTVTYPAYANLNIIDFKYYLSGVNTDGGALNGQTTQIIGVASTSTPDTILLYTQDGWVFNSANTSTYQLRNFSTNAGIFITKSSGLNFSTPSDPYNLLFDPLKDTYGITTYGTGIEMRGYDNGLNSGDTSLAKNITIENCVFDGMGTGVLATGTVTYPIIESSVFNNLYQGVVFSATNATVGPSNAIITKNRFQNIIQQGIYVSDNFIAPFVASNHRSVENLFVQVGNGINTDQNGAYLDDQTTSAAFPVITFNSRGNVSTNDTFVRRQKAESRSTDFGSFYYNPLVVGHTSLDDGATYLVDTGGNLVTDIFKIPLTDSDQVATIRYQLTTNSISRKGELLVNITANNDSSISDYYNYNQILTVVADTISVTAGTNGVNSFISNDAIFATVSSTTQEYYIIDANTNLSAFISSIEKINVGNPQDAIYTYLVTTDPSAGFDFTNGHPYQVGVSPANSITFITNSVGGKNYITIQASDSNPSGSTRIEFQVNLIVG